MGLNDVKLKSVLLVDDDASLTRTVATLLRLEGFEVWTGLNGIQGYASYFRSPTEFVVTDIQMPEWDGFEMVRAIRAINPGVKVVYVSGAVDRYRADIENEEERSGALFLEKPFSRKELLDTLGQPFSNTATLSAPLAADPRAGLRTRGLSEG